MASIVTETGGRRLIQLSPGEHPDRPKIRFGKVSKREAETALVHVEAVCRAKGTGHSYPPATADWLGGLPHGMRRRLERVGLIAPQSRPDCPTLGEWLEKYLAGRSDVKDGTATFYGHTARNLLDFFGADRRLDDIAPGEADGFRVYLKTAEGLADNTIRRRMGMAKQFFRAAIRRRLVVENPFDGQATVVRQNPKRFHFVTRDEADAVLAACPDVRWRLVFALCRYGGLRCPSEITRLTWGDVNWEKSRFTVHACKTEHHEDAGIRVVPIFPELLPHLQAAFDATEPGETTCCPQYANASQMYRKYVVAFIRKAGLKPWAKVFQNCRSSRETELAETYPVQVVCSWIGNSPQIAAKHYLQTTEDHFRKAVQNPVHNPVQTAAAGLGSVPQDETADESELVPCGEFTNENASFHNETRREHMGDTGFEPVTSRV